MNSLNIAKEVIDVELKGLEELRKSIGSNFEKAIGLIIKCTGKVVVTGVGKSGHIGFKMAATMASTGTPAFFVHPTEASHGDLGMIAKNDIVIAISNSGETKELSDLLNYCKRQSIKLISITKNEKSILALSSDIILKLPDSKEACPMGLAPTTSTTLTLVLGDCLAICLLKLRKFEEDDFKAFHPGGKLGKSLLKVDDIMVLEMPIVNIGSKISLTINVMEKYNKGCVGIVDEKNVLRGIFTDGDLLRTFNRLSQDNEKKSLDECGNVYNGMTVEDVMTENPIVCERNALASEIFAVLDKRKINSIFVCENEKPVGIVHFHDILKTGII